jgi:phage baseplate assembly protein W
MNSILSDFNRPSYQPTVVAGDIYKDVSFSFIHPATGDVLPATDIEAVKNSIKNIVLTPRGTRPFFPEFGTRVSRLLFELASPITSSQIKDEIIDGVQKFEKRVSTFQVRVDDDHERNAYRITTTFQMSYGTTVEFIFLLIRNR